MKNERYTSIMFDIVDSRKLEIRYEVQEYMKFIVDYLNLVFEKSLEKPLKFSAGDEVQGLFTDPLAAYICLRFCMILCYPVRIRAGIGYGKLSYNNIEWNSTELDGVVYHNARYAIESLKGRNEFGIRLKTETKWDMYTNALLYSSQLIQSKQSESAFDVKLIGELIFPLYDKRLMTPYSHFGKHLDIILNMRSEIQRLKSRQNLQMNTVKANVLLPKMEFSPYEMHTNYIPILEILKESDLIVDNIWKKGMSTMISDILGTTRQNIDKHIRNGKIVENRRIDFTIAGIFLRGFEND